MKPFTAVLMTASFCFSIYITGCETSHTQTDGPGFFGGQKHEETTTTKNPVTGATSTSHTEQTTN